MDYVKVESLYKEIGQEKKFKETADYNRYKKELRWYHDVRSNEQGNTIRLMS